MRLLILLSAMAMSLYAQSPPIEPGVSHDLAKWRAAHYSDVRYKLNLTFEKMSPVLKGTIEVRVVVRDAGIGGRGDGAIVLDWRKIKGFEDRSTISNVSVNGRPVQSASLSSSTTSRRDESRTLNYESRTLNYEESSEHLIFRGGVVAGENVIKLDFTSPILTSGSAITRYVDKEDGAEYIYSLFVPSDASTAFPVFDQPDLKARFTLSLTAPKSWRSIVSNADLEHLITVDGICGLPLLNPNVYGGNLSQSNPSIPSPSATPSKAEPCEMSDVWGFKETKPISTYVFAFAAGPWSQVSVPPAVAGGPVDLGLRNEDFGLVPGATTYPQSAIRSPRLALPPATAGGTDTRERVGVSTPPSSSIYVRKSQLQKFQPHAAEVFRLNREGVKYLEQYFDYKFPSPKYDLVLIPEFPFGGMEHAGATFLREDRIIFAQEPTKNDYITRANLIFHEAAHQWFGDTVTMRWFDDLWLKEGFAEFMAYKTLEKVMPEYNAWKVFYERNKQAAYLTDSTKGTTPIYQEIKNLNSAKSAYGNIVYRKAPSFLKQAEFYIGPDKFQTAVRSFLKKHEFANAGWEDLVREFENIKVAEVKTTEFYATLSAPDKSELEKFTRWSIGTDWVKFWVAGRGMPIYRISPNVLESNGLLLGGGATGGHTVFMKDFSQNGTVENLNWLQNIRVLKAYDNGEREQGIAELGNRRYASLPDEEAKGLRKGKFAFTGSHSGSEAKTRRPVLVFPNYQDYGYGIFLLDNKSRNYVLKNIQNEKDDFLRAMMWGSLWDSVREGELDPKQYVELVIQVQSAGLSPSSSKKRDELRTMNEDETTSAALLNRVATAMTYYRSEPRGVATGSSDLGLRNGDFGLESGARTNPRSQIRNPRSGRPVTTAPGSDLSARLESMLIDKMRTAPTLGQRITYYRALLNVASTENARRVLKEMLAGKPGGRGIRESEPGAIATGSPVGVAPARGNPVATAPGSDLGLNIPIKTKDRFDIVTRLLILNDPDAPRLLADLEKSETSDEAKRYAYAARAGIATAENKAKYWNDFTANKEISESWIEAAFGPFNSVRHADLTLPYLEGALKELPNHKRNRKIFFVNGWLGAFIGGQKSEEALAIVNKFLADNPSLDRDLRLKILENVDLIERAVKIRRLHATR